MDIAILGSGRVGAALGAGWAAKGHRIVFGVPDPAEASVRDVIARCGASASATTVGEAASGCGVILLAFPWNVTGDVLGSIAPLDGKVVIDCINPTMPDLSGLDPEAAPSAAERIVSWAPGAKVVKAFNTVSDASMADSRFGDQSASMFYCGDDDEAKAVARALAADVGLDPVDAGPMRNARHLEALAMVYIHVAVFEGGGDCALKLVRR